MAQQPQPATTASHNTTITTTPLIEDGRHIKKLSTLPKHATLQKRRLIHPPIPTPQSGRANQKVVYLGSRTPFVSALKRVRNLLENVDRRATQAQLARSSGGRRGRGGRGGKSDSVRGVGFARARDEAEVREIEAEPVIVKATGKAVEKALGLAVVMGREKGWRVRVRTGSVVAIDDVVVGEEEKEGVELVREEGRRDGGIENVEHEEKDEGGKGKRKAEGGGVGEGGKGSDQIPETRVRFTSMIEIEVTLRGND